MYGRLLRKENFEKLEMDYFETILTERFSAKCQFNSQRYNDAQHGTGSLLSTQTSFPPRRGKKRKAVSLFAKQIIRE